MRHFLKSLLDFFSSLRLTVACLSMAMVLVFFGTLAQVKIGLWAAQENYFQSLFVYWTPSGTSLNIPVWPGGWLLGGILLVNLLAAHHKRFSWSRKKAGIIIIHAGLILLLVGQFATEVLQVESFMRLEEGDSKNYSESHRENELVVIDITDPHHDKVVAIPENLLARQNVITHPELPFKLRVHRYFPNSEPRLNIPEGLTVTAPTQNGIGQRLLFSKLPLATKMDDRNIPAATVEVLANGGTLGTWAVSNWVEEGQLYNLVRDQLGSRLGTLLDEPQLVEVNGRHYLLAMRLTRYYKPFSVTLLEFRHDRYKGTEIPKNFSSRVRLERPDSGEDREVLIYMNNPLRYWGETYYQASFEREREDVTILQVVRNPSWLTPYLAVTIVGLGLTVQFLSHLFVFVRRKNA
jgi:hypothetical protein